MNENFRSMIENLSKFHREHEKFYAKAPLGQAIEIQDASRTLKTLADKWLEIDKTEKGKGNPYMGCEDLNETSSIQSIGVLFMEGEEEPQELKRLKRDLKDLADDFEETGEWLSEAMESSWKSAENLLNIPQLAGILGERHRIIINDWQAAHLSSLISTLIRRALEILEKIKFTPEKIRKNLEGKKTYPEYLYSASELLDRASDLSTESANLVHDNERRWRMFRQRVNEMNPPKKE